MNRPAAARHSWVTPWLLVLALSCTGASAQTWCPGQWTANVFTTPGVGPGTVYATCLFDDGTGLALYVGGQFQTAGGVSAPGIARFDGTSWSGLWLGVSGFVQALATFDDGAGPALYATGSFPTVTGLVVNNIAKWNGTAWSALGGGLTGANFGSGPAGYSLAVYDDGTGPALYVGGAFTTAGSVPALNVAKWNGSAWAALGAGTSHTVRTLLAFDAGAGTELFAGGDFNTAGGFPASKIARWNGTAWSSVGSGLGTTSFPGGTAKAFALAAYDSGSGPALYVAGSFDTAGGVLSPNIARLQAGAWSAVGSGSPNAVWALARFNDGTGPVLAATNVTSPSPVPQANVRTWNGTTWSTLTTSVDGTIFSLTSVPIGPVDVLVAGGLISLPGLLNGVGFWSGVWNGLGTGPGSVNGPVSALLQYDLGGPALYAGGSFNTAAGVPTGGIAKLSGGTWSPVGLGLGANGVVGCLALHDFGSGPELYAGGLFLGPNPFGGPVIRNVARWNGNVWAPLGNGISGGGLTTGYVHALASFDDGTGPALYAGGSFSSASGVPANNIAKWDGTAWSALGAGTTGPVYSLAVHDDGTGPALYVGGYFGGAGGTPSFCVAKWSGGVWSPLAAGLNAEVRALAVFDDGSGTALYAGGQFQASAGQPIQRVARWNGFIWSQVGAGLGSAFSHEVFALRVHNDGSGPALYAGGTFPSANGAPANNLARWNGVGWAAITGGTNQAVNSLASFDSGTGPALIVGGAFSTAGTTGAEYLARWSSAQPTLVLSQAGGPGAGVFVTSNHLVSGRDYCNVFSLEPALGGPGTGRYLGLWASDVNSLVQQVLLPIGAIPFHFTAAGQTQVFGPYLGPPGIVAEGICFDFTGNLVGCVSPVGRITVQ